MKSHDSDDEVEAESKKGKEVKESRPERRKVVPDDVWAANHGDGIFSPSDQNVDAWLLEPGSGYGSWIGGGDIIKLLMMEAAGASPAMSSKSTLNAEGKDRRREAMETLLLMANHPQMKILSLRHMHWGHHFGVSRVAEEAVKAYVYLNLLVAMREQGSDVCDAGDGEKEKRRRYMDLGSYQRMLSSVAGSYDGDAQTLVHREFFLGDSSTAATFGDTLNIDVVGDMEKLKEYLKGIWRVMITYGIVIREAGGDPNWEVECRDAFGQMFGVFSEM